MTDYESTTPNRGDPNSRFESIVYCITGILCVSNLVTFPIRCILRLGAEIPVICQYFLQKFRMQTEVQ